MNSKELAEMLNGNEIGNEISKELELEAKENGLVVVFGASDDLMVFRGAIDDSIDASGAGGCLAYLTADGLLERGCNDMGCVHHHRAQERAVVIDVKWLDGDYAWIYETQIPHHTFEIFQFGDKYCLGIVFALSDVYVKVDGQKNFSPGITCSGCGVSLNRLVPFCNNCIVSNG